MSGPGLRHNRLALSSLCNDAAPSRWITRERPKIDRIACPWLVRRFIDPDAIFVFVRSDQVLEFATTNNAIAFDIPGAPFSHVGDRCSFDAFVEYFEIDDDGVAALAPIIRGADTDCHEIAPQAAGLHALSLGLALMHPDDQALLEQGMHVYDALYAWATNARGEKHNWTPP